MPDLKISALTAGAALGSDILPVETALGANKGLTLYNIFAPIGVANAVTAYATGGQTNATELSATARFHRVATCATAGDSVKLPAASANAWHYIRNDGAAACQVFGASTDTINGVAYATGVSLAAGVGALFVCTAAGNWTTTILEVERAIGKQSIWIPAGAMTARTTNGASPGTAEMTTNKNMVKTLDFDASTQEFAQFDIRMPKSWNEGTVTFVPVWSHASTTTNFGVVWGLDAVAISNDDALDVAFGTEQTSTDTGGTTNDLYEGPESSAITIAGTPAVGDYVQFRIHRNPASGSDTMAVDARLHGIMLFYTTDAVNDA